MEKLLNKLIEKGWKPFGYKGMKATVNIYGEIRFEREGHFFIETFRTLTSKESGLWQFVCENGMVGDGKLKHNWVSQVERGLDVDCKRKVCPTKYEYRLIESALCDEDKLEDFLLNNIKIDDK